MSIINGFKGAFRGAQASQRRRAMNPKPEPARDTSDDMFCIRCGNQSPAAEVTPGSIWIELVAWCFFLVPGFIYSLWRHNKKHMACPKCESAELIPADSPMARSLKKSMSV